jgi:hypothetical protein
MQDETRRPAVSGELDRELRSTLAALQELGPAYEPELAAALNERLQRFRPPTVLTDRRERPVRGLGLPLPLVAAAAVAGAMLLSAAAHTHSASWRYGRYREWQVAPFHRGVVQAPPVPPAPSVPPGTD